MSAFHTQAAGQGDLAQLEALKGRTTMWTKQRASLLLAGAVVALVAITGERAYAQAEGPNSVKPRPLALPGQQPHHATCTPPRPGPELLLRILGDECAFLVEPRLLA